MANTIIENWEFRAKKDSTSLVIPDGCRDVLFWVSDDKTPHFSITSLDETSYIVPIKKGDYLRGFRLKPGVSICEELLLASLSELSEGEGDIIQRIGDFTLLNPNVKQALDCLASGVNSVKWAAKDLGVSTKTLQRLISKNTGRTPASWLSLARVRTTARIIGASVDLAQSAIACGYFDQSHMNREFKRWLNITPTQINSYPEILRQLDNLAYN